MKWVSSGRRVYAICTMIGIGLSGCGASNPHRGQSSHPSGFEMYSTERLIQGQMPDGGTFAITGERYRFHGEAYFGLKATVSGSSGRHRPSGGTSSTSIKLQRKQPLLTLFIQTSCVDARPYVLAAGIVRALGDIVIAINHTRSITTLRQLPIPARFRVGGTLAYALLPWFPSQIIVRSPNGRILTRERYTGLPSERCTDELSGATSGAVG
jgi:hypothetical protein